MKKNTPAADTPNPCPALIDASVICAPGSIRLELCGRSWVLARPSDLESLWESISDEVFADDERLPYWVELWPSSLALGVWLADNRKKIAGRVCLDLGCGLGFTAILGSWLGARVIGMDYEPEALAFARSNAISNTAPKTDWLVMDWRTPALAPKSLDFVWGGDIMYENRFVEPIFTFLDHTLAPGGIVWMAEPGRGVYTLFRNALLRRRWSARCIAKHKVMACRDQTVPVNVALWELARPNCQ